MGDAGPRPSRPRRSRRRSISRLPPHGGFRPKGLSRRLHRALLYGNAQALLKWAGIRGGGCRSPCATSAPTHLKLRRQRRGDCPRTMPRVESRTRQGRPCFPAEVSTPAPRPTARSITWGRARRHRAEGDRDGAEAPGVAAARDDRGRAPTRGARAPRRRRSGAGDGRDSARHAGAEPRRRAGGGEADAHGDPRDHSADHRVADPHRTRVSSRRAPRARARRHAPRARPPVRRAASVAMAVRHRVGGRIAHPRSGAARLPDRAEALANAARHADAASVELAITLPRSTSS